MEHLVASTYLVYTIDPDFGDFSDHDFIAQASRHMFWSITEVEAENPWSLSGEA